MWGETDKVGDGDAVIFSHFFALVHDQPHTAVHEFGHSCGLKHPFRDEKGGQTLYAYPQYAPYRPSPSEGSWRIGTPGWDPTNDSLSMNSWSWSYPLFMNPIGGMLIYDPNWSNHVHVIDIMDYGNVPTSTSSDYYWISDYHFTKLYFKAKGQELNDDVSNGIGGLK